MCILSTCRDCGNAIVWGVDEDGKRIPLDPRASVYHVTAFDWVGQLYVVERIGPGEPVHYVSHFWTCPKARHHSNVRRDRPAPRSRAAGQS